MGVRDAGGAVLGGGRLVLGRGPVVFVLEGERIVDNDRDGA